MKAIPCLGQRGQKPYPFQEYPLPRMTVSTCVHTSGRHFYHMEYFHLFKISFGQGQKGQLSGVDNRVVSVDKGVWMKVIQQKCRH